MFKNDNSRRVETPTQAWKIKLFTSFGDSVLLDIGELWGMEICEEKNKHRIVAIMSGGIRISLTKLFDSESQAKAMLDEFRESINRRIRFFVFGKPQFKKDFPNQSGKDIDAIEKGENLEM